MGVTINRKGSFKSTLTFLKKRRSQKARQILEKYGEKGVEALRAATPKRTGITADSWGYKIIHNDKDKTVKLIWTNTNTIDDWANVAVLIQYGHATGTGGWVEGIDYINPAMKPIFEEIARDIWWEVTQ
jgi:hypothetical protein